jgi:hypothetical protein
MVSYNDTGGSNALDRRIGEGNGKPQYICGLGLTVPRNHGQRITKLRVESSTFSGLPVQTRGWELYGHSCPAAHTDARPPAAGLGGGDGHREFTLGL